MEEDYLRSVVNVELYRYYKSYVEPLEREYDELALKYEKLLKEHQRMNKDPLRYREMALKFKQQRDEIRRKYNG